MAVVVEPTLPFLATDLKVGSHSNWVRLFPLINPALSVYNPSGRAVLVNKSSTDYGDVLISAIVPGSNLSSKLLEESALSAFALRNHGKDDATALDLVQALASAEVPLGPGVVVVRSGSKSRLELVFRSKTPVLEVDVVGDVHFDHVLSLLSNMRREAKRSLESITELISMFLKSAKSTTSVFQTSKIGEQLSRKRGLESLAVKSAKESVFEDLALLLESSAICTDSQMDIVYSVHYANTNGLSQLENYLVAHAVSEYLTQRNLPFYLTQSAISSHADPARGYAISLCVLHSTLLCSHSRSQGPRSARNASPSITTIPSTSASTEPDIPMFLLDESVIRVRIIAGCDALIANEAKITEYDTIVGDGDCGYTLRDGAAQVRSFIARQATLVPFPSVLNALVDDLEVSMGGTSGALYCIFLSALSTTISTSGSFADALVGAQTHLLQYTKARVGDRTCIDCLVPFVEGLKETGLPGEALNLAREGVARTERLEAMLGRSAYLNEESTRGVPDPGAYGLLVLLEGMINAAV
ncbi:hypothetical protein V496_09655 [Pseudogymnoascus sp. VKM F-4515 (FW-2607)]|nr:hypothetical protein V496_09655 [Pseudogymnoascus sp. VKM F-4515 (FW-2607)]KFY97267.1 hypothetical protein V498_02153 [Pseudogymnoascus sp. VKM F-4517 (FW-2822)]